MILVAGLSPAWQQIIELDALLPGQVNRARQVHWVASGKVLNVATALANLGAPCEVVTVAGGAPKAQIERHCDALGIRRHLIETGSPTRTCTTVLDRQRGEATELVENAAPISVEVREKFTEAFSQAATRASLVLLTGSLPPDTPPSLFRNLMSLVRCPVLLDIRGPELLSALALRPLLVKPNREELSKTVGQDLATDEQVGRAMSQLQTQGAQWVLVTHGSSPICLAQPHSEGPVCTGVTGELAEDQGMREVARFFRCQPAKINAVNPIGSGDCLLAGIAWGISQEKPMRLAIALGIAAAVENAQGLLPGNIDPVKVAARAQIHWQTLY